MDLYALGLRHVLGHARLSGRFTFVLASIAWESYFKCLEWNRRSFKDTEKTLEELFVLCQRSLFNWSRC